MDTLTRIKKCGRINTMEDTNAPRNIGILDGIASYKEEGDGKISLEEFLGSLPVCWTPVLLYEQP
jgi:hypothetical protein